MNDLLAVWAALCGASVGALTMLSYGRLSPQARIAELSAEAARTRTQLRRYDGSDVREVWSLTRRSVGLSLRQIGMILPPTLCAALPALAFAWLLDRKLDFSRICIAPGSAADCWLSGQAVYWLPLGAAALAVKCICKIK